jgi:hypothetical protein
MNAHEKALAQGDFVLGLLGFIISFFFGSSRFLVGKNIGYSSYSEENGRDRRTFATIHGFLFSVRVSFQGMS